MNKKIIASTLSILATLAMMGSATYAYFTDTATSENNVFSTGNLTVNISEDHPGFTVFNEPKLQPGDTKSRCLDIVNTGSLDLKYKLTIQRHGDTTPSPDLSDVLTLKVERWTSATAPNSDNCTGKSGDNSNWSTSPVINGAIKTLGLPYTTNPSLGILTPTDRNYYRITVNWPNGGSDDKKYEDASASYDFIVNAGQKTNDPNF